MIGTNALVAIGYAGPFPQEQSPIIAHLLEGFPRLFREDLHMFTSVRVGQFESAVKVFDHDDFAKRIPRGGGQSCGRECFQLSINMLKGRLPNGLGGRDQLSRCIWTVFALRQEVSGASKRIGMLLQNIRLSFGGPH